MKMKCILCTLGALVMCTAPVFAQAANKQEKSEFNPHWFMQVQAGASYTLGEGPFGKLVSPAAALSAGYQFSPVWGLRFGLSGWQSKGAWVSPQTTYQYKYLQGNVEATLDLANLFGRFNPRRTVNPFLFAGVGLNGAFDNDEANALNDNSISHISIKFDCGRIFIIPNNQKKLKNIFKKVLTEQKVLDTLNTRTKSSNQMVIINRLEYNLKFYR